MLSGVNFFKTGSLAIVAAALFVLFNAQSASADACGVYNTCLGLGDHRVACPGGTNQVRNCHAACGECVFGECHPGCAVSAVPGISEHYADRHMRLVEVASSGSASDLLAANDVLPGSLYFNRERDSVQLVGCDGRSVIANLPIVSPEERAVAASRLPSSNQIDLFASGVRLLAVAVHIDNPVT